ncbi:MAG: hypothetical protein AAB922_06380 [Patescibacteria group bacterium]
MSLPNLKDKIEGKVPVVSGRSGVMESPKEDKKAEEPVKLKGRINKKVESKKKK